MPRPLLLSCEGVGKAYGTRSLFDDLSFGLFEGDQAGLVGPNGAGKSTLLKILTGDEVPDRGTRSLRAGVRIGYVPQDPAFPAGRTVEEILTAALAPVDEQDRPGRLAHALGRAGFSDGRAAVDALSGGWRKRLAIARELAAEPDIVLMDEPTNHLDVDGILWLETLLAERARAFLVVSHDRYFLEHVATRMLELNRAYPGGLFQAEGPYSEFLARRDESSARAGRLPGRAGQHRAARDRVAAPGGQGAVDQGQGAHQGGGAAHRRSCRTGAPAARRPPPASTSPRPASDAPAPGGARPDEVARRPAGSSATSTSSITPGTRVGVIGPNGSGKTTLLNLLAGALPPTPARSSARTGCASSASSRRRAASIPPQTLRRALAPEGDAVIWQGRSIHVAAWAKRFLFRRAARRAGGPPLGRRAGAHPHRAPDARARRSPHPRRAHQRSRHSHTGSARGQPGRVRRRPGPRHPRPLHAGARVHA